MCLWRTPLIGLGRRWLRLALDDWESMRNRHVCNTGVTRSPGETREGGGRATRDTTERRAGRNSGLHTSNRRSTVKKRMSARCARRRSGR
jgi:hypothetical protein